MKKDFADLGKTEWLLLNICWEKGKKTMAKEIYDESLKDKIRSYTTVKTMLDRLVIKGYLFKEKFGPVWLYSPQQNQKKIISLAIDEFMNTVLGNNAAPIFKHIVESKKYNIDIDKLKEIIDEIEE